MKMVSSTIPGEWQLALPESLVAGAGPYSAALASILGTVVTPLDQLYAGPARNAAGGYSLILENVAQALLVIPEDMTPGDALQCHEAVWVWIEKLSPGGVEHEVRFLLILPESASNGYEEALAVGLCVPVIDPATTGYAVWRRSGELLDLLELIAATRPMDLVGFRGRRSGDFKWLALAALRAAVMGDDPGAIGTAARAVLDAFEGAESHLDSFCRPPTHLHGNHLRKWLKAGVTGQVTQDWCTTGRKQLFRWLAD